MILPFTDHKPSEQEIRQYLEWQQNREQQCKEQAAEADKLDRLISRNDLRQAAERHRQYARLLRWVLGDLESH